ncbi:hypothetical protein [Paenibacillus lemnae]|nr:hypothetical protein [Paenibacillus lemnae]
MIDDVLPAEFTTLYLIFGEDREKGLPQAHGEAYAGIAGTGRSQRQAQL